VGHLPGEDRGRLVREDRHSGNPRRTTGVLTDDPPPGVEVWLRSAYVPPRAASAWATVGQVAALVVAAAVVGVEDGEVAGGDVGLVGGDSAPVVAVALLPPELHPVMTRPTARAPAATIRRLSVPGNLRP
jgi:hypothetical protein